MLLALVRLVLLVIMALNALVFLPYPFPSFSLLLHKIQIRSSFSGLTFSVTCNFPLCQHGGICKEDLSCSCPPPYYGVFCEQKNISDCSSIECENGGRCIPGASLSDPATCDCDETGYLGERCQTAVRKCYEGYCKNGGVCVETSPDFIDCKCSGTGFSGRWCNENIDDCTPNPCLNGGICHDGIKNFTCECLGTGFEGSHCQVNIDDCDPNPCLNGGKCIDGIKSYKCDCNATECGGETCQYDRYNCKIFASICQNRGTCEEDGRCECEGTGFEGPDCSLETITCEINNPCLKGGTCIDLGINQVTCLCPPLFAGKVCEVELLTFILIVLGVLLLFLAYALLRWIFPQADNLILVTLTLALYDFITDCLFAASQSEKELLVPAVLFLAVPILFNLVALFFILFRTLRKSQGIEKWLEENYGMAALGILLASTNIECVLLLSSNLFHSEKFRAPLGKKWTRLLFLLGVVGNVLEDIPQLLLQSYATKTQGFSTLVLLSIIASVLSLTFSLIKRAIFYLLYRFGSPSSSAANPVSPYLGAFRSDLNEHLLLEER